MIAWQHILLFDKPAGMNENLSSALCAVLGQYFGAIWFGHIISLEYTHQLIPCTSTIHLIPDIMSLILPLKYDRVHISRILLINILYEWLRGFGFKYRPTDSLEIYHFCTDKQLYTTVYAII